MAAKSPVQKEVNRQFKHLYLRHGCICVNPITGGNFVGGARGEDSLAAQKRAACRAIVARAWHSDNSPNAPPLPVDMRDIYDMVRATGFRRLFGSFAQSIAVNDYRVSGHPPWEIFAAGMLASPHAADFLKNDKTLTSRFPPRPIYGLATSPIWNP